jgi:hypothetical protein
VRRALLFALVTVVAAACSGAAAERDPSDLPVAGSGTPGADAESATMSSATIPEDSPRPKDETETDEAPGAEGGHGQQTELGAIADTLVALEVDLQARDLDAATTDARTLLDRAETLEADAGAAAERQRPLEPQDPELQAARSHALDAFGLTEAYAASITDVATAVLEGRLGDLPALVRDASELAGTSEALARAYADLNTELGAWAEGHPAEAARALAEYGS